MIYTIHACLTLQCDVKLFSKALLLIFTLMKNEQDLHFTHFHQYFTLLYFLNIA